jgi:hypothetical protein
MGDKAMAYGVYFRGKEYDRWLRVSEIYQNRKNRQAIRKVKYTTLEEAKAKASEYIKQGYEAVVKEVK